MDVSSPNFIYLLAIFTIVAGLAVAVWALARVRAKRKRLGETREEHIPMRDRRPGEGVSHPADEHPTAAQRAPGARGTGTTTARSR